MAELSGVYNTLCQPTQASPKGVIRGIEGVSNLRRHFENPVHLLRAKTANRFRTVGSLYVLLVK